MVITEYYWELKTPETFEVDGENDPEFRRKERERVAEYERRKRTEE